MAAIMRSVIACSLMPKEVWTLAMTQSSSAEQVVLVVERAVGQDVDLAARQQLDPLERGRSPRAPARSGGGSCSGETSSPKPWLAEWSVIARYS